MQSRDHEILQLVNTYRVLEVRHIQALLGGSPTNLENRCRLLWQHGYLDRPQQSQRAARLMAKDIVYALACHGAEHLELNGRSRTNLAEKNRRMSYGFIEHLLLTNTIVIAFSAGAKARGYTLRWSGHDAPCPIRHSGDVVEPDAFFWLEHEKYGKVAHFVEVDRSTVPGTRMRDRFARYVRFWAALQEEVGLAREWGFEHFRVVIVTETRERMDSLRQIASAISPDGDGSPWPGFLFTHQGAWKSGEPERTMDRIFLLAQEDDRVSLLD